MPTYEGIMKGLQEAVDYTEGRLAARKNKMTIVFVGNYTPTEIRKIRMDLNLTQPTFAGLMGVSVKTVEAWESGMNTPSGSARRLMEIFQQDSTIPERMKFLCRS
ncbi:MAG: helix-turn-helix domain-containing protein [Saccharofermentanales bacterium]